LKKSQGIANQLEASNTQFKKSSLIFDITGIQVAMLRGNPSQAMSSTQSYLKNFPNSRALNVLYIEILISANKLKEATDWLLTKTKTDTTDSIWWNYLAKTYEQQNKIPNYHAAVAEKYAMEGALPAAIEQLKIARDNSENNFYQLSELDARKRQLEQLYKEELIENGRLERSR
jgi:predicted Zn-dependent protease